MIKKFYTELLNNENVRDDIFVDYFYNEQHHEHELNQIERDYDLDFTDHVTDIKTIKYPLVLISFKDSNAINIFTNEDFTDNYSIIKEVNQLLK